MNSLWWLIFVALSVYTIIKTGNIEIACWFLLMYIASAVCVLLNLTNKK